MLLSKKCEDKENKPNARLQGSYSRGSHKPKIVCAHTPQANVTKVCPDKEYCKDSSDSSTHSKKLCDSEPRLPSTRESSAYTTEPVHKVISQKIEMDLEKIKSIIENYKNPKLDNETRKTAKEKQSELMVRLSKIVSLVLLHSTHDYIEKTFTEKSDINLIISSLNTQCTFIQRLEIIESVGLKNIGIYSIWTKIKDFVTIIEQLKFEQNLSKLQIAFLPITKMSKNQKKRARVILTDVYSSNLGFESLLQWNKEFPTIGKSLIDYLKKVGPEKIINDCLAKKINCADIEIAWGHIMNQGRHANEDMVFVCDKEALKHALNLCPPDSTLVLDGHGGSNQLKIGISKCQGDDLKKYISEIVKSINSNVSHVILSVCSTGTLKPSEAKIDDRTESPRKNKYEINSPKPEHTHKNRKKIFLGENEIANIPSMFEPITSKTSNSTIESFASYFSTLLFNRSSASESADYGTAFTFSPSLLIPDSVNGGVMGVHRSIAKRKDWPDYHKSWIEQDENCDNEGKDENLENNDKDEIKTSLSQIAFKSITFYNNAKNRKALSYNGDWKHQKTARVLSFGKMDTDDDAPQLKNKLAI